MLESFIRDYGPGIFTLMAGTVLAVIGRWVRKVDEGLSNTVVATNVIAERLKGHEDRIMRLEDREPLAVVASTRRRK